jgi:hypothetical protein
LQKLPADKYINMKKIVFYTLSLFIGINANAQQPEKYAATITKDDLKRQLTIVAGPEMEGRETATEGQRKAAAYIAGQFKQLGLREPKGTKDYLQLYPLYIDSLAKADMTINNNVLTYGKDFTIAVPNRGAIQNRDGKIKAKEIVFVGYGISDSAYDDYAGKRVRGKVVLMFAGEPKNDTVSIMTGTTRPSAWSMASQGMTKKALVAKSKGAKAVLFVSPLQVALRPEFSATRKTGIYYPVENSRKNEVDVFTLSHDAAASIVGREKFELLLAQVKAGRILNDQKVSVRQKTRIEVDKIRIDKPASNVVGYLEGTDKKDEFVVLTAHYDHLGKQGDRIFYGADDDGSGTVTVIEMAEAFAKAKAEGNGPRRSIVFMAVSGEEKGLLGSQYYGDHPLFPLNKTTVNLNTDMIGRIDPSRKVGDSNNYVYVIGDDKLSSDLAPITDQINSKYIKMELDRKYNDLKDQNRFYYRSDHYNFAKKGVPIIFYFNGVHPDYHRATDTVDKINFGVMEKRARLIFHTAWEMANRNEMLKRDIPLSSDMTAR